MANRYFQLLDEHGLSPVTGKPDPIVCVGLAVAVPTMVKGEVVREIKRVEITSAPEAKRTKDNPVADCARILPGSRVIECSDHRFADGIAASGQYVEVDPPDDKVLADHVKQIAANVAEAKAELGTAGEGGESS